MEQSPCGLSVDHQTVSSCSSCLIYQFKCVGITPCEKVLLFIYKKLHFLDLKDVTYNVISISEVGLDTAFETH